MDKPRKSRHSASRRGNAYVNIIYKMMCDGHADDIILRFLLTVNPKVKRNKVVEENIDLIKEYYPAVRWTEEAFHAFHSALMGKEPSQMDKFLEKYTDSPINGFCECIKKDIAPVKNAISLEISSGFVEGNNNKFKLLKRIVYGRSGLVNLEKNVSWHLCLKQMDSVCNLCFPVLPKYSIFGKIRKSG